KEVSCSSRELSLYLHRPRNPLPPASRNTWSAFRSASPLSISPTEAESSAALRGWPPVQRQCSVGPTPVRPRPELARATTSPNRRRDVRLLEGEDPAASGGRRFGGQAGAALFYP